MGKLQPFINSGGSIAGYMYFCPGCECYHAPYVRPHKSPTGSSWEFNGDLERPTFKPSILTRVERSDRTMVCHSFVTDGKIRFLGDSTHSPAGQVVDVPEVI
jgi:hypothetical protein